MVLPPLGESPLVSIIVANYNYGRFLPDAVESVLTQTYPHWELIICDDGSTDDSLDVAQRFACIDTRIIVIAKENRGQASAWNVAHRNCRGDVICFLDSDDKFFPTKLEDVVSTFMEARNAGFLWHGSELADEDLNRSGKYYPSNLASGWLLEQSLMQGGVVVTSKTSDLAIRREVVNRMFPIPESLRVADGYVCRVAPFLTEIVSISKPLSLYRLHGNNVVGLPNMLDRKHSEPLLELKFDEFKHQRCFLSENFEQELAERVRFTDQLGLLKLMSALYILKGKPSDGILGFEAREMLRALSTTRQKYIWQLLFALPATIAEPLLRMWWSDGALIRLARPVMGILGMRESREIE